MNPNRSSPKSSPNGSGSGRGFGAATTTSDAGADSTSSATRLVPSTLQGPPVAALVKPGQCQFTDTRTPVKLMERIRVSPTSSVLRFALPDPNKSLQLSTCACLLAHANIQMPESEVAEDVTRPYTPISTNAQIGSFDLLVKDYGPTSKMSHYLHTIPVGGDIDVGDSNMVEFSHKDVNVKIQAPFDDLDFVGMLVGGTGITPMIQALHAILGDPKTAHTKVCLLYGSKVQSDILAHELLQEWARTYPDRFTCIDVLSDEPVPSDWTGRRGFIDRALIAEHFPSPSSTTDKIKIFICGPPIMYDVFSGPRLEKGVSGILAEMGYTADQVYKF